MDGFIGREEELAELKQLEQRGKASLVIMQGRRRIGKSRLIEQFAESKNFYEFAGLAPDKKTTAQDQRDAFGNQLAMYGIPAIKADDWSTLFWILSERTKQGKVIILLDEISWMGSKDSTFLGKLKNAWDMQFSKNPQLMLILCGSVSSWIEENIIGSTEFLGRPTRYIKLHQIPLNDCDKFWGNQRKQISAYEKFKVLAVTGGVPKYLELIDPKLTAEENIRFMAFTPNCVLAKDFERIFADIFGIRSEIYKKIVSSLLKKSLTQMGLLEKLKKEKTGDISKYLKDLVLAGFVKRDYTWDLKTGVVSKLSKYRLADNYLRFYLKYLEPNQEKIEKGFYKQGSMRSLLAWDSIMGLQFENLVLANQHKIFELLNIKLEDIVFANPYFQTRTTTQQGCQIDFLIQTKYNTVYVCEVKLSKHSIKLEVIDEVKEKLSRLKLPKNMSYRAVLIHVNGVSEEIMDADFFSNVIDFGELLNQ